MSAAFQLDFQEEGHIYHLDGRRVPSVTAILKPLDSFEHVPPHVLEAAREFGSHVHEATHLDDVGDLDEASLSQELWPYVTQWRKFRADIGWTLLASELRVAHPRLRYAGGLDNLFRTPKGRLVILDKKSGVVPISVGPQVAAYAEAYRYSFDCTERIERYCLELGPDKYRLHPLTDPSDFNLFLSCLNVHTAVASRRR